MTLRLRVDADGGDATVISARLRLKRAGRFETLEATTAIGLLRFEVRPDDELLSLVARADGHWTARHDLTCGPIPPSIPLAALPDGGPRRWWHDVMGMATPDAAAGARIRVGIIDTGFHPDDGLSHARILTPAGAVATSAASVAVTHGEIVARLIGQRSEDPTSFGGMAPGAEIVAVDVSHPAGGFDPVHVANAIIGLAEDHGCHLINFSGGRYTEKPGLLAAIRRARVSGSLCIVAAGNEDRDEVAFPARYGECIAVGAVGCRNWGPADSQVRFFSDSTPEGDGRIGRIGEVDLFHFALSCHGEGLDVVAPGVGLVICRGRNPVAHSTGTSYAAPLVTGTLAAVLARDESYLALGETARRAEHAERRLREIAERSGMDPEREGMGVPRCLPSPAPANPG